MTMSIKKSIAFISFIILVLVIGLRGSNLTAPLYGILQAGSPNVQITGGVTGPLVISVSNGPDNGVTVIGLTNANSPLFFPFMGFTYTSRFCIVSEAWSGLTNGVIHWRGDGANPGQVCVSPREFWFQTNWNWLVCGSQQKWIVYSNDVGKLNEGTVVLDVDLISAWYTNTVTGPTVSQPGYIHYNGTIGVSNGTCTTAGTFTTSGNADFPFDSSLFIQTNSDGSFLIVATNFPGQISGYCGVFADYVLVHTRELTTGTNWPFH